MSPKNGPFSFLFHFLARRAYLEIMARRRSRMYSEPPGDVATTVSLVDYPLLKRLKVDAGAVQKKIGKTVQRRVRARIKKGMQDEGVPLPNTKRDSRPMLRDSGRLINSIKYDRGEVAASGKRRDGHKWNQSVQNRNAAIMAVQIFTQEIDPLGPRDFRAEAEKLAAEEIQKQIENGALGFSAEMQRITKLK